MTPEAPCFTVWCGLNSAFGGCLTTIELLFNECFLFLCFFWRGLLCTRCSLVTLEETIGWVFSDITVLLFVWVVVFHFLLCFSGFGFNFKAILWDLWHYLSIEGELVAPIYKNNELLPQLCIVTTAKVMKIRAKIVFQLQLHNIQNKRGIIVKICKASMNKNIDQRSATTKSQNYCNRVALSGAVLE